MFLGVIGYELKSGGVGRSGGFREHSLEYQTGELGPGMRGEETLEYFYGGKEKMKFVSLMWDEGEDGLICRLDISCGNLSLAFQNKSQPPDIWISEVGVEETRREC